MDKASIIAQAYEFKPTDQQMEFCRAMAAFLSRPLDRQCFVLRGYAGTGKTTSVAALVKVLRQFALRPVLLAPTGRAAKVMGTYTGRTALTIHKKIYRKRSAVSPEMTFQLAPNLAEHTVFIVDEASMIADDWNAHTGSSLLKDLMEFVYNGKNCGVIMVGDTAQLPPVGSVDSPALNPDHLAHGFGLQAHMVELREVVRQGKRSGILANATKLRKMIIKDSDTESGGAATPLPKFVTKGYKDVFRMTGLKLVEGLEYAYSKFGLENTLIVCRSNKSANTYNQQIRARLLYREEELTGGDQIMVVKNNYFWLPDNESAAFIANGDMARVIRVRGAEERYGLRFCEVMLEFPDFPAAGSITCKVILDTLTAETPNLSREQSNRMFEELNEDYGHIADKRLRFKAIKEDPYYNALQIKFSYAVTCHKAQGGQWEAVFVDQGYLTDDMVDTEFLRWLYTAVTRAKSELFFVNFASHLFTSVEEESY
ncbi:ATP-dependent DNA helicase [Pedobacter deserti]|uniref:ATP-dependent DNA helicase n=1 Tax=Pedobacter deserti TaxID=2817382 RepID=UPI00210C227F|nr:AAA family ATPase [Pedobacter sp. SYSU D00382]